MLPIYQAIITAIAGALIHPLIPLKTMLREIRIVAKLITKAVTRG